MKKLIKNICIVTVLSFLGNPLYAAGGHNHNHAHGHGDKFIDSHAHDELYIKSEKMHSSVCFHEKELERRKVQRAAKVKILGLVAGDKIPASWFDMPIIATDKKKFTYQVEWVVQFKDKNVKDKTKQIIYVFVDLYGQVTGANYIGH